MKGLPTYNIGRSNNNRYNVNMMLKCYQFFLCPKINQIFVQVHKITVFDSENKL